MRTILTFISLLFFITRGHSQSYIFAKLQGTPIDTTGWNFSGAAYIGNVTGTGNGEIMVCPANYFLTGAVFYKNPINLSLCNRWAAEFDFRIYDGSLADGLAFCFLDTPPSGYVVGGGMGIPATANGLKICFDPNPNCFPLDFGIYPKIEMRWGAGYDECWTQPTVDNSTGNLSFIRSNIYNHAKITYDNGNISVYVNDVLYVTGYQQFNFPGYLGFTAATGAKTDNHSIKNVTIYTDIPPSEAGNDQTICSGESVQIGTANQAGYVYQWSPIQGLNSGTVSNPTVQINNNNSYDSIQKYYVQTALSGSPACSSADSITITIKPVLAYAAAVTADKTNITTGTLVTFTATTINLASPITYQWYKNNQPVGTNANFYTDNTLNNGDSVWVSVTGNNSCGASTNTVSNKTKITVTGSTCTGSLGEPIVNVTFGAGPNFGPPLAAGITSLQYLTNSCPNDGQYSIVNYSSACFSGSWLATYDHTGDPNGYFMLVNASYQPSDFYVQKVNGLCAGTTYEFSAWLLNMINFPGILPNITFNIEKTDGSILQSYSTGDIAITNPAKWKQYNFYFTTPVGISDVVLRMRNNAPGGIGNDIALDDITFRPAGPKTAVTIKDIQNDSVNTCSAVTLASTVEACYASNDYQWQLSVNDGPWANIPGAVNSTYQVPVQSSGNYKYRLFTAQSGNINITTCRVYSNPVTIYRPKPVIDSVAASFCVGKTYTLPWGIVVNTPGIYADTLYYTSGCDSIISKVALKMLTVTMQSKNAIICSGQTYTLPSGKVVASSGTYQDTVRYTTGCDSLVSTITLKVNPVFYKSGTDIICPGDIYTLPWGSQVSTAGIYHDTTRYITGCDSLIWSFDLAVRNVSVINTPVTICEGETYTLPWGTVVSSAGIYSDTLHYQAGCDSIISNIIVRIAYPVYSTVKQPICPGQTYKLPSGAVVKDPGSYTDTLRNTATGCDSIITDLTLYPGFPPVVQLSKSNDVSCNYGISKLNASGAHKYIWSPSVSLDNSNISNPTATPDVTTTYHVKSTSVDGCTAEDSITVYFTGNNSASAIQIPNAFTPNSDGINDCFGVKYLGAVTNLQFSIYNRWGKLIFSAKDPSVCWDGTYKGQQLTADTFIYQFSVDTQCGKVYKKGTVTLVR